jgi:TPR repeat protein
MSSEPFKNTVIGIVSLGIISSLAASYIWTKAHSEKEPKPASVSADANQKQNADRSAAAPSTSSMVRDPHHEDISNERTNRQITPSPPDDSFEKAESFQKKTQYEKAAALYDTSCKAGNSKACIALGILYFDGRGVNKSYEISADLYRKACDAGNMVLDEKV